MIYSFSPWRSGQHGILNWLCNHFTEKMLWINDIGHETVRINNFEQLFSVYRKRISTNDHYRDVIELLSRDNIGKDIYINVNDYDLSSLEDGSDQNILLSHEDFNLNLRKNCLYNDTTSKKDYNIFIIRDCYNCAASRINNSMMNGTGMQNHFLHLIEQYYKHFLALQETNNTFYILYNKWFSDKLYRESIVRRFGLEFTDKGLNEHIVPIVNTIYDTTSAQSMKVFDRWKEHKDHVFMSRLLQDSQLKDLREMCHQIFDFKPEG